jgi:hypothetical protein
MGHVKPPGDLAMGKIQGLALAILVLSTACSSPSFKGKEGRKVASTPAAFRCSKIEGASAGDFSFVKICLNNSNAVLQVGSFEISHYAYKVKRVSKDELALTPIEGKYMDSGHQALNVALSGDTSPYDLMDYLDSKGAGATLEKAPTDASNKGPFVGRNFETTEEIEL